jgi:hypothetical protein
VKTHVEKEKKVATGIVLGYPIVLAIAALFVEIDHHFAEVATPSAESVATLLGAAMGLTLPGAVLGIIFEVISRFYRDSNGEAFFWTALGATLLIGFLGFLPHGGDKKESRSF